MISGSPSDETLVAEAQRLSGEARQQIIDALFAKHYTRVTRWCYRLTGDAEAAADLAQNVFLKAHAHFESFQGHALFTTWLYAIVRHESLSWRRRRQEPETGQDDVLAEALSPLPDPESAAAESSRGHRVHEFLGATLDRDERVAFTLHYGQGLPLDAITNLLRLDNRSGAKALIVSAKRKIARAVARMNARGEQW